MQPSECNFCIFVDKGHEVLFFDNSNQPEVCIECLPMFIYQKGPQPCQKMHSFTTNPSIQSTESPSTFLLDLQAWLNIPCSHECLFWLTCYLILTARGGQSVASSTPSAVFLFFWLVVLWRKPTKPARTSLSIPSHHLTAVAHHATSTELNCPK